MKSPILSIVIPVYNEAERLPRCLENLSAWLRMNNLSYEILAVDNGSTDATHRVLRDLVKEFDHFSFEILGMRGKGRAVAHGMLTVTGEYRYMCDVDLSTPPFEIERFLKLIRYNHVVIGSREAGARYVTTTTKRRVIGRLFHLPVSLLVPGIEDTQCGFKMFAAQAAQDIFDRQQIRGLAFDVEALWLARQLGYSVVEMPVTWRQDKESRVRLVRDGWDMLRDVLSIPLRHFELRRAVA